MHPESPEAWRDWLAENHGRGAGVWLVTTKKAFGGPEVTYDEAVTEALAWGWVDSKPSKLDERRSMLWFAPRKGGSGWARPNKERIARLIESGRMQPAGMAKIEAAKADGTWTLLDDVEDLVVPEDLAAAFGRHPGSRERWEAFPRSPKRGILEWIVQARTPVTREKRIEETARLAALGERANAWRRK